MDSSAFVTNETFSPLYVLDISTTPSEAPEATIYAFSFFLSLAGSL